eukprot:TRINITY_DN1349_c0_g3_i1.p2 TRINITY_DN1349_c0_g3~~TRINITY_DN1349_c0_g3_i1.p2  ORF type:complete len:148 (+),score=88.40 TRINITY_DN1349_c0_g3_i1:61-504(+)
MSLAASQIKEVFDLFDSDSSGVIDAEEMHYALKGLGFELSQREVSQVVERLDKDGNGVVEFEEFEKFVQDKQNKRGSDDEIKEAFKLFDLDNTGFVSLQNMLAVTEMIGENTSKDVLAAFIKEADLDKDSQLSLKEWQAVMSQVKDF